MTPKGFPEWSWMAVPAYRLIMKKLARLSGCLLLIVVACSGSGSSHADGQPNGGSAGIPPSDPGSTSGGTSKDAGTAVNGPKGGAPFTLTPLTTPKTQSANISLYFSVTDADGLGVQGLKKEDFDAREDGVSIDPNESDFQTQGLDGQSVAVPTVLMLDLSGSVVAGGALDSLKKSANQIIDGLIPEQKLAIISFADVVKTRIDFTADKAALHAAVNAISGSDGPSTNLYGAIVNGMNKWTDGFQTPDSTVGQITAGIAIVITDGKDTAGLATLEAATQARGNKRLVAIGVGPDVDVAAMKNLVAPNDKLFLNPQTYQDLEGQLSSLTTRLQSLGRSVYTASYCSPKRAGQHELSFSLKANGAAGLATCTQATFSGVYCPDPIATEICGFKGAGCCPASAPFRCSTLPYCYATAEAASTACAGASCTRCGGTGSPATNVPVAGLALQVAFNASSYQSPQCPKFRGPQCKAFDACCASLPAKLADTCAARALVLNGNESFCGSEIMSRCPTVGPECQKQQECCKTFGVSYSATCWSEVLTNPSEPLCTSANGRLCGPLGPNCTALRTCCRNKVDASQRNSCDSAFVQIQSGPAIQESACSSQLTAQGC